jgi:type I restriction enzyme R subunit
MAFRFCVFTLASDGIQAKYGTPFTPLNHFSPWNVDDDGIPVAPGFMEDGEAVTALETALQGLYNQERFLQLVRNFTAFDEGSDGLSKRIAKPHQYFAVTKAAGSTVQAVESNGKAGVVWHTQGSGQVHGNGALRNTVARHPKLKNPTVVVITDRNELDGQLFEGSAAASAAESPKQIKHAPAPGRTEQPHHRRHLLHHPASSAAASLRRTPAPSTAAVRPAQHHRVVDEAHRSHYDDLDGYARHLRDALPHATLIAFTGTPSPSMTNTPGRVRRIHRHLRPLRAVEDGATVPVYFEPRLIKVGLASDVTEEIWTRPPTKPPWGWTRRSGRASRRVSPS